MDKYSGIWKTLFDILPDTLLQRRIAGLCENFSGIPEYIIVELHDQFEEQGFLRFKMLIKEPLAILAAFVMSSTLVFRMPYAAKSSMPFASSFSFCIFFSSIDRLFGDIPSLL